MKNTIFIILKKHKIKITIAIIAMVVYYFCLPKNLFNTTYSTVVISKNDELLGAKIAEDGQWRFPQSDSIPHKFKTCIVFFEDEYFQYHPGINPISIAKAGFKNFKEKKIKRGGSSITQQVIRLHRQNKPRTFFEKFIEFILATRLEFRHTKNDILNLYASHAPFGGNVVGLEMASFRYFGLLSHQLSWAESATLAVLPNAPSLIYPGKNKEKLLIKRNSLLLKLYQKKIIDTETYQLSILESLPEKPFDLPQNANHLVMQFSKSKPEKKIKTSINSHQQDRVNHIVNNYYNMYKQNEIHNIAVLVANVQTREIISYVGNTKTSDLHNKDVDIIPAARSTGSVLKPFLYAAMLNDGEILPKTLIPDIPTQIANYIPQNFENTYDGAVPAKEALSRSLNIPYVLMLKDYSVNKFYDKLKKLQLNNINRHPTNYGLSLILGGAESNLLDLCSAYANLGATLNYYNREKKYREKEFQKLTPILNENANFGKKFSNATLFSAGAIFQMFTAMKDVNRPPGDEAWKYYDSSIEIAWKTGTSFGSRDAWAIGINKDYIVGIWVGNASGEGRPGLTGVQYAGPILFDVFRGLPKSSFFDIPKSDFIEADICSISGHLATNSCPSTKSLILNKGTETTICPYHKKIFLNKNRDYRVHANCESLDNIITETYFILPPVQQWYYKSKNLNYKITPPYREDCQSNNQKELDFIYPRPQMILNQTKDHLGNLQPIIAKVAHNNVNTKVFWYLNEVYLGTTKTFHEMPLHANSGNHTLTVVDEFGNDSRIQIVIANE